LPGSFQRREILYLAGLLKMPRKIAGYAESGPTSRSQVDHDFPGEIRNEQPMAATPRPNAHEGFKPLPDGAPRSEPGRFIRACGL
jgi:hypothetical protein